MNTSDAVNSSAPFLVIGGGIAGLSAAVEASEAGHEVILVEKKPWLGGRVVQMNKYFPKLCPPTCGIEIHLKRLRSSPRVRILTSAEVTKIGGTPGAFTVDVKIHPRGVNANCTNCGDCVEVCPKDRPNEFNYGMDRTKAIYLPFDMAYPQRFAIDFDHCDGESCAKCVPACKFAAIDLAEAERTETLTVGAFIVATGWKPYDATKLESLAYGRAANVVTNVELERLAALNGPTGGKIQRPGDGAAPKHVAFVQCAGSRDDLHLAHCSAVCCSATMKQARYVLDADPEAKVTIFYIDRRTPGRLELFLDELERDERVTLVKGRVAKIEEAAGGAVALTAEVTLTGKREAVTADLAVLATGLVPESMGAGFPDSWKADAFGFLEPVVAPGVFSAGCAKRPGEVSGAVKDATAAVLKSIQTVFRG